MSIREEKKQHTRQALLQAALNLCYENGSFSSISLRDISQSIGLVPTAFYRHFKDLNALSLELVDHASIDVRNVLHQVAKMASEWPYPSREERLDYFFNSIADAPETWHFFLSERFAGHLALKQALQREYDFLLQDITARIHFMPGFDQLKHPQKIPLFAEFYLDCSLIWAAEWLRIQRFYHGQERSLKHAQLKANAFVKIQFLYEGLEH